MSDPPGVDLQKFKIDGHRRPTFVNKIFPYQLLKEFETDTGTIKASIKMELNHNTSTNPSERCIKY